MGRASLIIAGLAIAGIGLIALLRVFPGPAPALALIAVALGLFGGLVGGWQASRGAVRAAATAPVALEWVDAPPAPEETRTELDGLGYELRGGLRQGKDSGVTYVYVHRELPIYVLSGVESDGAGEPFLVFESFFQDGSRVTTTTRLWPARVATAVETERPRLVQLRKWGTPTALDGQHVGTVRAWTAGGRAPLPSEPESLIGYLEEDRSRLAAALEAGGWLPLSTYLSWMAGGPRRILKF